MLKNKIAIKFIVFFLLSLSSVGVYANRNLSILDLGIFDRGVLDGVYTAQSGFAKSQELYPGDPVGEQLGEFKIVLLRNGWASLPLPEKLRIRRRVIIEGVFSGIVDYSQNESPADPVVSHQMSNKQRTGAVFTDMDQINVVGFEPCSQTGGVFNVIEVLKFERGSGIYENLHTGGAVVLEGTINTCTFKNDFSVLGNEGGLCFGDNCYY